MLASKRQLNFVNESHKVFQFLPLHFIAESAVKDLATLLVREFACFLFASGSFGAVLSIETPGIPLTVDKEFVMVKLTSFSDVHQKLLSSGRGRKEAIRSLSLLRNP
jgi:hypothetical protein